jgi:hypothetical protein
LIFFIGGLLDYSTDTRTTQRVAFVITITAIDHNYFDGAAVLAHSIRQTQPSSLDYDLIAIIHDSVPFNGDSFLIKFGYKIIRIPTPINVSQIKGELLRNKIMNSGCCGEKELIKLEAFRLFNYDAIILLDTDTIVLKHKAFQNDINKLKSYSILFSFDRQGGKLIEIPNTDNSSKIYSCANGGFFIAKPSLLIYNYFVDLLLEGKWNKGWNNTIVGDCWGGESFTGILSYYIFAHYNETKEVDNCRVNGLDKLNNENNEICELIDPTTIEMFHFESKRKPWLCLPFEEMTRNTFVVVKLWWKYRSEIIYRYGFQLQERESCNEGHYVSLMTNYLTHLHSI